jgi:hypothetical protein
MMDKMLQRAQLDKQKVEFHTLDTARFIDAGSKVVLLGDDVLKWAIGEWDLFRWRGRLVSSGKLHNSICLSTLLPSEMLPRNTDEEKKSPLKHKPARFQGIWVWDVNKLVNAAAVPQPRQVSYFVDPPINVWNQLVEQLLVPSEYPLSFDIETAYKMKMEDEEDFENDAEPGTILRISFSNRPDFSVSVHWGWPYLDGIIRLLASNIAKLGWNLNAFDIPRLEEEQIRVNGEIYDGMDAWHMLRSEQPMGLEYVTSFYTDEHPWKHLSSSNPGLYSCKDADFALRNFIGIQRDLQSAGMWELFMRHSVRLMPILRRAGKRGCLVDVDFSKSLEKEMQEKKDEYESIVQQYIPKELFPRKRYKRDPWPVDKSVDDWKVFPEVKWEGRTFVSVESRGKVKYCTHCGAEGVTKTVHFKGGKKNPCVVAGASIEEKLGIVWEWDEILPFNLNSSDQVKAYIRHFNHEMGKNRKTDADSANGKHLKKLMGKYGQEHPFYEIKIEYAKVAKTISTYVYHRKMDANQVVHGWFNNSPTTWRLAQRAQNFTNVGKRETNPWAVRARNQLIARPGHCFVNADSTSIEAVIVGMLIGDQNYIKMANKSIHAWLCCLELGIEFNDANVEMVKKNHKDLYNKFKVANYLLMYGGDPYLMHMEEPKTFPTKKAAEEVKDKIFTLIPALANWQDETRKRAKKEGVLTTPWGYRHYFYDVYTFARNKQGQLMYKDNGEPKIKLGQDSKTALAFQPQNIAAGFGRETCLIIGNSEWGQYMCANCFVHDGYTLESPYERRFECAQFLIDTLTRPVVELGNLRFGCEVEIGPEGGNWGDYHSEKNPMGLKTWKKVEV